MCPPNKKIAEFIFSFYWQPVLQQASSMQIVSFQQADSKFSASRGSSYYL